MSRVVRMVPPGKWRGITTLAFIATLSLIGWGGLVLLASWR